MINLRLRQHRSSDRLHTSVTRWVGRLEALESRVVLNGAVDVPAQFNPPLHTFRITSIVGDEDNNGLITTPSLTVVGFAAGPALDDFTDSHVTITIEVQGGTLVDNNLQGGTVVGSATWNTSQPGTPALGPDPNVVNQVLFQIPVTLASVATAQAVNFRVVVNPYGTRAVVHSDNTAQPLAATFTLDLPTTITPIALNAFGNGTVSTAAVTFSEPVSAATFTVADLTLTRDGVAVTPLTGVAIATTPTSGQANSATFVVTGLWSLTAAPGNYVLTVNGAGIQDAGGIALTGSQQASFTVLPDPGNGVVGVAAQISGPTHEVMITAIPQNPDNDGVVATQSVVFEGFVQRPNRGNFTDTHMTLRIEAIQGGTVVGTGTSANVEGGTIIGSVTWDTSTPGTESFRQDPNAPNRALFNLPATLLSATDPAAQGIRFRIVVQEPADEGVLPPPETRLVLRSANTTQALTANLSDAGPTINPLPPITVPVQTVDVTFSEAIDAATFTVADLTLTRDGQPVTLTGVTITPVGTAGTTFQISGLQGVTTTPGTYVLTVNGAGIQDLAGNAATGSQSATFVVSETGGGGINPLPPITSPRTEPLQTLDVTFSEAIDAATFTVADLTLTRDGQPVTLTGVTVTPLDDTGTRFRISGLQGVTTTPGTYVLTVNGAGIQDLAGNAIGGTQVANFIVQPAVVGGPQIVDLDRFGFHSQPTLLVLTFDRDLAQATAVDRNNYRIFSPGRDGQIGTADDVAVPVSSAVYDPATRTVTLLAGQRLSLFTEHELFVRGTGAGAITDVAGNPLDGGDFSTTFDGSILAGQASSARKGRVQTGQSRQQQPNSQRARKLMLRFLKNRGPNSAALRGPAGRR